MTGSIGAGEAQDTAAKAVNALGLDLLSKAGEPGTTTLISPYSIQVALAMTFAGADGDTRAEMARVLHYSAGAEKELHKSFAALQRGIEQAARASADRAEAAKRSGGETDPFELTIANRLYGQEGYEFRPTFISITADVYGAPFQMVDFVENHEQARKQINEWVEEQTRERISDLVPPDGLNRDTRLVLVNAIYMKAAWAQPFREQATRPEPFHLVNGKTKNVQTMRHQARFGYIQKEGFSAITLPYSGGAIQFLVLLPDEKDGLAQLEKNLTPEILEEAADAPSKDLILWLPKFKIQPPLFRLGGALKELGMKSAFNVPEGSANFDRMAPRRPNDYLYISEVFHKTFLDLDEKGTEAAAATAVSMIRATSAVAKPKPIEVKVDRPFLFAIQHRESGACLFLGRMTDPR
jgi:serpin B